MRNRLINVAREKYSNLCDILKFKINKLFDRANCWVVLTCIDRYGKRLHKRTCFQYAMQAVEFRAEQMNRENTLIFYFDAKTGKTTLWY